MSETRGPKKGAKKRSIGGSGGSNDPGGANAPGTPGTPGKRGPRRKRARRVLYQATFQAAGDDGDFLPVSMHMSTGDVRVDSALDSSLQSESSAESSTESRTEPARTQPDALALPPGVTEGDWIELFPSGISVSSTVGRPVLILKDKSGAEVLPVWMHPLDAGVALAELSQGSGLTPHVVTRRILEALDLTLDSCVFTEMVGHHQFVRLHFRAGAKAQLLEPEAMRSLKLRADEAMSFCLQSRARFFSTRGYMARCRDLDAELGALEQGLASGMLPTLQAELEISSKKHPYMM